MKTRALVPIVAAVLLVAGGGTSADAIAFTSALDFVGIVSAEQSS